MLPGPKPQNDPQFFSLLPPTPDLSASCGNSVSKTYPESYHFSPSTSSFPWLKPGTWIILQLPPDVFDSILCPPQSLLQIVAKESYWPSNRVMSVFCLEPSVAPYCPYSKIQTPHPSWSPSLQPPPSPCLLHSSHCPCFLSLGRACICCSLWLRMLIPQTFKCCFLLN